MCSPTAWISATSDDSRARIRASTAAMSDAANARTAAKSPRSSGGEVTAWFMRERLQGEGHYRHAEGSPPTPRCGGGLRGPAPRNDCVRARVIASFVHLHLHPRNTSMARGVNKVILIGNLGADPETRYTASGSAITSVSLATSENWKDKQTGEAQERTEWHRVKFFGRLAEIAGEYLKKGRQVYIEGSIRSSKYTDKEGVERWSTDIIANEMQMLGGSGEGGPRGAESGGGYRARPQQSQPRGGAPAAGERHAPAQQPAA